MTTTYQVGIASVVPAEYPSRPPFHPDSRYPELAARGLVAVQDQPNRVFAGVRALLRNLGLDSAAFGTSRWNPLGEFIRPRSRVVIKPNLVLHESGALIGSHCLTTDGSVIRALVDYAYLALEGDGELTIADAPLQSARFDSIVDRTGLDAIQGFYRQQLGFEIGVVDLRQVITTKHDDTGFIVNRQRADGDKKGYALIDLGAKSAFELPDAAHDNPKYRVADYEATATAARHGQGRHEYVVSKTILDADTVLLAPKLKVHEKVGLTACLKGMVGIIGSKDCLPHFREGAPSQGGDEFPDDGRWLASAWSRVRDQAMNYAPEWAWSGVRFAGKAAARALIQTRSQRLSPAAMEFGRPVLGGAWPGNDTTWRMTLDLNYIFRFARANGTLARTQQRQCFAIVDGIIGGERCGPLNPSPRTAGLLIGGRNPWAVDVACARLIGFDWRTLRLLRSGWPWTDSPPTLDIPPVEICADGVAVDWDRTEQYGTAFSPPPHWDDRAR